MKLITFGIDKKIALSTITLLVYHYTWCMKFEVYLLGESTLPVNKKERRREGKEPSALGWNMDMQTLYDSAHIQTKGAAYSIFHGLHAHILS